MVASQKTKTQMKKSLTCSEAFDGYLKELALGNFPTGNGQWRSNLQYRSDLLNSSKTRATSMTTESLHELNEKGPFKKDVEWSRDVKKLQSESVKNPALINKKHLQLYIKHLRLVDKNISIIDYDFHKFSNLSELILSANYIEEIKAAALPSKLKVLELCGNRLTNVESLSVHGPPLQHLGLSYNLIKSVNDFVDTQSWDSLLSLDLSFNFVENLNETSSILSTIPKLRNLSLQGNPVFLFAGYRGYVIDTIKTLSILDDVKISADERHVFKGISRMKDLPFDEFQLNVQIDHLKGLKKPDENENVEEFPRTISKYHVEIDFISSYELMDKELTDQTEALIAVKPGQNHGTEGVKSENDLPSQPPEVITSQLIKTNELAIPPPVVEDNEDVEISFNFTKMIKSKKLNELRDFLSKKVDVRIVEDRILINNEPKPNTGSFSAEKTESLKEPLLPKNTGRIKSKISIAKKEEKEKTAKGGGGKVAKKTTEAEIHEWSRTQHTIACSSIDLEQILTEDCSCYEHEIKLQRLPTTTTTTATTTEQCVAGDCTANNNKKSDSSKKLKQNKAETPGRAPSRTTSSVRNNSRNKMKCDTPSTTTSTSEANPPLKDITLLVVFELERWKSAKDGTACLKLIG